MKENLKNSLIPTIPLLSGCDRIFLENLNAQAQHQSFEKGRMVFLHTEDAQRFYYIKSGWIKLFRETLDGSQVVLDALSAGQIFGETAIFEDNTYPFSAEVVEPAEIISFPLSDLRAEVLKNGVLTMNMLRAMAHFRRQQNKEIEHLSIQNAAQRVGCFLLRLAQQRPDDALAVQLPYDKTVVAARLGMQPETFSRALAKLKMQTGIKVEGAFVQTDDIEILSNYACSACSSKFPCQNT